MFGKRKRGIEPISGGFLSDLRDILANGSKAEFEAALNQIRVGRRFITPHLLLLQLQFGTVDTDKIRAHVMEFDWEGIIEALDDLIAQGLR